MIRLIISCLVCSSIYTACTSATAAEAEKKAELVELQAVIREEADKLYQARVEQAEIQQEVAAAIDAAKQEAAEVLRLEEEKRQAEIDHEIAMESGRAKLMQNMQESLVEGRQALRRLELKHSQTSTFKLGRSKSDKKAQLASIKREFDANTESLKFIEREISRIAGYQPVEQQRTPEGLINWISWSATRWLSDNLTPLTDPYNGGPSSRRICYIGALSDEFRKAQYGKLEDLQIISKEVGSTESELKVKVANDTEVFVINLIKRGEYWYVD